MLPLVSIIMPAYNSSQYIEDSIKSVINQTYSNFELIICNDKSTDNTLDLIMNYTKLDTRIICLNNTTNLGAPLSRNRCIDASNGKYIAFLDADDLWNEEKLSLQINFMEENYVDFCFTYYSMMSDGSIVFAPSKVNYSMLKFFNPIGCLTVIYNTHRIGKIYQPNIRSRNDFSLWILILKKGFVAHCLKQDLAVYNNQSVGISSNFKSNLIYYYKALRCYGRLNIFSSFFYTFTFLLINVIKKLCLPLYNRIVIKL